MSSAEPFVGWLPKLIGAALALLVLIVIAVGFTFRELKRKRTFYGREEQPSHVGQPYSDEGKREAQDDDEADERQAAGECLDAIKIVKSIETVRSPLPDSQSHPHSIESMSPTPQSVIKVLHRQRKRRNRLANSLDSQDPSTVSSSTALEFRFNVELDLIPDRSTAFLAIVRNALFTDPGSGGSAMGDSSFLCERLVSELRRHLDRQQTGDRWMVHVRMGHHWRISGQDNLLSHGVRGTQLMLRLTVTEPLAAHIFALRTLLDESTSVATDSLDRLEVVKTKLSAVAPSLTNSSTTRTRRKMAKLNATSAVKSVMDDDDASVTMTSTTVSKTAVTSTTSLMISDTTATATPATSVTHPTAHTQSTSSRRRAKSTNTSPTVSAAPSPATRTQRSTDDTVSSPTTERVADHRRLPANSEHPPD